MKKLYYLIFCILAVVVVVAVIFMAFQIKNSKKFPELSTPTPASAVSPLPLPAVVMSAIADLSKKAGVSESEVKVISVESAEWMNSCLGISKPGQVCAQVITPGYKVTLDAGGIKYVYHTDLGNHFVLE